MQFRFRKCSPMQGFVLASVLLGVVSGVFWLAQQQTQAQDNRTNSTLSPVTLNSATRPRVRKFGIHGRLNDQERVAEFALRQRLNQERLAKAQTLQNRTTAPTAPIVTDVNDISIVQDDGTLIQNARPFNLNNRTVTFTPSGNGYTVTSSAGSYDTNFGTKLNLTAAPAVNPKTDADAGDDAYLEQTLGFTFNFYGASYTSVGVSSNGFLVFRTPTTTNTTYVTDAVDSGESLAKLQNRVPRIAPYWHDLDATAAATTGDAGVYVRREADRVVVTWHNIRDFANDPVDDGVHRFQATLFRDGRITFAFDRVELTSSAVTGISPGGSVATPLAEADFAAPPTTVFNGAVAAFFTRDTEADILSAINAFYRARPGNDSYDFVYLVSDFDFNLDGAYAAYFPLSNDIRGINQPVGEETAVKAALGSQKIQGILLLSNILTSYPASPAERLSDTFPADNAFSIWAQEQGHRWLAFLEMPGTEPNLLLGRDDAHWNFFMNIESSNSTPAARRASSMEGNVWRDNGDNSFNTVGLVDGYSRLDHYVMGLRPASEVTNEMFIIKNPSTIQGWQRDDGAFPGVRATGMRQNITMDEIIQKNGVRQPSAANAPKKFRAAVIILARKDTPPSAATLTKLTRYRLAWESYFAQATDNLGSIETGLATANTSRVIAPASAASYSLTLTPGAITALFGAGLTDGATVGATTQPLPTTLAGTQVLVDGFAAPLFFVSPNQINFQIPRGTLASLNEQFIRGYPSRSCLIEIVRGGQTIRAGVFQIAVTVPAVFTLNQSGSGAAAAVDAINGSAAPFAATRASGEPNIISLYGTGLGADGTDVDGNLNSSVQVRIDNNPATVQYAGRAPGLVGVNQLNVVLPAGITSGNHTVTVLRNNIPSNNVTIAIR